MIRTYSELVSFNSFEERFEYLKLCAAVGEETFGFDRYLNQLFYRSLLWKKVREEVILRDNGCDLGVLDNPIKGKIIVHHMNPVEVVDFRTPSQELLNPEYLISVSLMTHNALHYGVNINDYLSTNVIIERRENDTKLW